VHERHEGHDVEHGQSRCALDIPRVRRHVGASIRMPSVKPYKAPRTRPVVAIWGVRILRRPFSPVNADRRVATEPGHVTAARTLADGARDEPSDRQAPAVRPERLPVEGLVERRARQSR
jgi:hypothetical protein